MKNLGATQRLCVALSLSFAVSATANPPKTTPPVHDTDGRAHASPSDAKDPLGWVAISDTALPEEIIRHLEANVLVAERRVQQLTAVILAQRDGKLAAADRKDFLEAFSALWASLPDPKETLAETVDKRWYNLAHLDSVMAERFRATVRELIAKKKITPAQLSYLALYWAEERGRHADLVIEKLKATLPPPAGHTKTLLDEYLKIRAEGKGGARFDRNSSELAVLHDWAIENAIARVESEPALAESYYRFVMNIDGVQHQDAATVLKRVREIAEARKKAPPPFKTIPDTKDVAAIGEALKENTRVFYEQMAAAEKKGDEAAENALAVAWDRGFQRALIFVGGKADVLPPEALLLADRICYRSYVLRGGNPGYCPVHFSPLAVRAWARANDHKVPPVVLKLMRDDRHLLGDFVGLPSSEINEIREWAEKEAARYYDSEPALAEQLALLAAHADIDKDPSALARARDKYPLGHPALTGKGAVARLRGPVPNGRVKFAPLPPRPAEPGPTLAKNRDLMLAAIADLKGDDRKALLETVARDYLAIFDEAESRARYDGAVIPFDAIVLADRLRDKKRYPHYREAAEKLLTGYKLPVPPALKSGGSDPFERDKVIDALETLQSHPGAQDPKVAESLGALLAAVRHHDALGATLHTGGDEFSLARTREFGLLNAKAPAIGKIPPGPAGVGVCVDGEAARKKKKEAGIEIKSEMTLEARIGALNVNKDLVYERLVDWETAASAAQFKEDPKTVPPGFEGLKGKFGDLVIPTERKMQLAHFLDGFRAATRGRPAAEKLAYPPDVLLLVDRISRDKDFGPPTSLFLARVLTSVPTDPQLRATFAANGMVSVEKATELLKNATPENAETLGLLVNLARHGWAAFGTVDANRKFWSPCLDKKAPASPAVPPALAAAPKTFEDLSKRFAAYATTADFDTKILIARRLNESPARDPLNSKQDSLAPLVKMLERLPTDNDYSYGYRREDVRRWALAQFGEGGLAGRSPELKQFLTAMLDIIDDHGLAEWKRPARSADVSPEGELRLTTDPKNAARAKLLEDIVHFYRERGRNVPSEVRLWVLKDTASPETLAVLTKTFMRHEPEAFMALLLDHQTMPDTWQRRYGHLIPTFVQRRLPKDVSISRDEALAALYAQWGEFTLDVARTPEQIAENRRRAKAALELLAKYKLTERELEAIFGNYFRTRTGWSIVEELSARQLDRLHLGDDPGGLFANRVASDEDKLGLRALLLDEAVGLGAYFGADVGVELAAVAKMSPSGPDGARRNHLMVWKAVAERRGLGVTLAREFWRPNEMLPDGLRAYARLLFSPRARGIASTPEEDDRAEKLAAKVGNTLAVLRATRGRDPSDADLAAQVKLLFYGLGENDALPADRIAPYASFIRFAREFEHRTPDDAAVEAAIKKHFGPATPELRAEVNAIVEALRVTRVVGDLSKKDGNPIAQDSEFDTYHAWATAWHDKITLDGKRLTRNGAVRDEAAAHDEMLIARGELDRVLDRGPSLKRAPAAATKTPAPPKLAIYIEPLTGAMQFDGIDSFLNSVQNADNETERLRWLKLPLAISVFERGNGLRPHQRRDDNAPTLSPWDQRYITAVEKLRARLLYEVYRLRKDNTGDPSRTRSAIQGRVKLVATLDAMLLAGLANGPDLPPHLARLKSAIGGDTRGYEAVVLAEVDALGPHVGGYEKIGHRDITDERFYERRFTDDELFVRQLQTITDDWYSSRGWQSTAEGQWKGHEPKVVTLPPGLVGVRRRPQDQPINTDFKETLVAYGYSRPLFIVPEEMPDNVKRALASLPPERRAYYEKEWSRKECVKWVGGNPANACVKEAELGTLHESKKLVEAAVAKERRGIDGSADELATVFHLDPREFAKDMIQVLNTRVSTLRDAGTDRQKASDLRQSFYDSVLDEYWRAHAVGVTGLPTPVRQELRKLPVFQREALVQSVGDLGERMKKLIAQAQLHEVAGRRAEADAAHKEVKALRLRQMELIYTPTPAKLFYAQWRDPAARQRLLDAADGLAKAAQNPDAIAVVAKLRDYDKLTLSEREALRQPLLAAFRGLKRVDGPESDYAERDARLAHHLAAFLNVIEDRGHLALGEKDPRYAETYELIRSAGGKAHPFTPREALSRLERERALFAQQCGVTPKTRNCEVLERQIARMDAEGFGVGSEARIALLDPSHMKPEHLDGLERAERVLAEVHDPQGAGVAKRELLHLRLVPSPDKVRQVLSHWDPAYQEYVMTRGQRVELSEEIIGDLLRIAKNGSALTVPIKDKVAGPFGQKACKDVRPRAKDGEGEYDRVINIAYGPGEADPLKAKMVKMARFSANTKAYETLSRNHQIPKIEELKKLADELVVRELEEIENAMRNVAAARFLSQALGDGKGYEAHGLDDPRTPAGCALRALLGPVHRQTVVDDAKKSYARDLKEVAEAIAANQNVPDTERTRRIRGWGAPGTTHYLSEMNKEVAKLVEEYGGTEDFHHEIDAQYASHVVQRDGEKVEARPLVVGSDAEAKTRDHLFACVDHYENKAAEKVRLPESETDFGNAVEKAALQLQEEIRAVQLTQAVMEREYSRAMMRVDAEAGVFKPEIEILAGTDPNNLGQIPRLEQDLKKMETHPKKEAKEMKEAAEELRKMIAKKRAELLRIREREFREKMRVEAMRSGPMEGRKTVEEEEADDLVARRLHAKLGAEVKRLHEIAKTAALAANVDIPKIGPWPSAEFIASLEHDPEITGPVRDFNNKKIEAIEKHRAAYAVPDEVSAKGDETILNELKTRTLLRMATMKLRAERSEEVRTHLTSETAGRLKSFDGTRDSKFHDYAVLCMEWLEQHRGFKFERVPGPQDKPDNMVFRPTESRRVAELLKKHKMQRDQVQALARAMAPGVGVRDENQGPFATKFEVLKGSGALQASLDALKKQMREGLDTARLSDTEIDGLVSHAFSDVRSRRFAETQNLLATVAQLAKLGFKWDGLQLKWDDLDLSHVGKPHCPYQNMGELRKALESLAPFGRYLKSGTDPWMELVSAIYGAYQQHGYSSRVEIGKTSMRILQIRKLANGERKESATGDVGDGSEVRDFLTDMANAENYLEPEKLEEVRRLARAAAQTVRQNHNDYFRRRKDLDGVANRLVDDIGFGGSPELGGLPTQRGFNPFGVTAGAALLDRGEKLTAAVDDARRAIETLDNEYGGITIDWENGPHPTKVNAHTLAGSFRAHQKYMIDADYAQMPDSVMKAVEAREAFLRETAWIEMAMFTADAVTGGASAPVHGAMWASRASRGARLLRNAASLYKEVKHGLRLANISTFVGKGLGDLYGNWRYGALNGNDDPEVASPWDQTLKGARHSRLIFGLLPFVNAGLGATFRTFGLPARMAPYVVGPVGMAGTSFGIEVAQGQDPAIAWKNSEHSLLLGLPFGEIMGKVGSNFKFIANSPLKQKILGIVGTYATFSGHSLYRARADMMETGKYVNPYTGEEMSGDEMTKAMLFDTIVSGAVLDGYFAFKARKEVPAATARAMLRRGVSPEQITKIYGDKQVLHEALGGYALEDVRALRDRQLRLAKEVKDHPEDAKRREQLRDVENLLDAFAQMAGFKNGGGRDVGDFLRYVQTVTGGREGSVTVGEIVPRATKEARHDLASDLRARGGHDFHKFLNHSLFYSEGRFDPEGYRFVPVEYLQQALGRGDMHAAKFAAQAGNPRRQGRDFLERWLLAAYYHFAGQESRAEHFVEFVRGWKLQPGEDLQKLVRIFRNATPKSINEMLRDGRLTPAAMVRAFPPAEVQAALDHMTVTDLRVWAARAADEKDPLHVQALVLMQAVGMRARMEGGLFMEAFALWSKEHPTAGNRRMKEIYAELAGPTVRKLLREKALSDAGAMDALVRDAFFLDPANHDILPPAALVLDPAKGADHIAYVNAVADHVHGREDRAFRAFVVDYLRKHKGDYGDLPTAIKDARTAFLKEEKARVAEWTKRADAMDPADEPAKKTTAQLRDGLREIFENPVLANRVSTKGGHAAAVEKVLKHLETTDPAGAVEAATDLANAFPKSGEARELARRIVASVLRNSDAGAAAKFFAAVRKAPNGGRLLTMLEPAELRALLEKVGKLHHTEIWGMARDMINESDVLDSRLPEKERAAALGRLRELALVAMENLRARGDVPAKNMADKINDHWRKTAAKARLTAPVMGELERALDRAVRPDLEARLRIRELEPALVDHPHIETTVKDDGKVTLVLRLPWTDDARIRALEEVLVAAAEGTADGEYTPSAMRDGGLEIRFQNVTDAKPGGRREYIGRVLELVDMYVKAVTR